jgi:hypothetical protein
MSKIVGLHPLPPAANVRACRLAIDQNVGGAIRSEICEFDIIFMTLKLAKPGSWLRQLQPLVRPSPTCSMNHLSHASNEDATGSTRT